LALTPAQVDDANDGSAELQQGRRALEAARHRPSWRLGAGVVPGSSRYIRRLAYIHDQELNFMNLRLTLMLALTVVTATHGVAGDGGWDYLTYDAPSNRLFVSRATHVQGVDPDTGRVLAEIADTLGVHGIALAEDLGKGYTSNGRENTVSVFDLKTFKLTAKVHTTGGENPNFIAYDAVVKRVFAFNGRSRIVSVIDATTDRMDQQRGIASRAARSRNRGRSV
jgi:hypothetical protein